MTMKFISLNLYKILFFILTVGLFSYSLYLPALFFDAKDSLSGLEVLSSGWWGALNFDFAWYANPIYIVALVFFLRDKFRESCHLALAAIGLGMLSFFAKEWWLHDGDIIPIESLGLAFYVWLTSFTALFLSSIWLLSKKLNQSENYQGGDLFKALVVIQIKKRNKIRLLASLLLLVSIICSIGIYAMILISEAYFPAVNHYRSYSFVILGLLVSIYFIGVIYFGSFKYKK